MCDLQHYNHGHDCHQFPSLKIEQCELCGMKTCGWTRTANVMSRDVTQPWTICVDCSTKANQNPEVLRELRAVIRRHNPRAQFN